MTRYLVSRSTSFAVGLSFAAVASMAAYGDDTSDRARVCTPGYAESIRPMPEITRAIKLKMLARLGIGPDGAALYEIAPIVPIALGGDPEDYANLQLQPLDSAHHKSMFQDEPLHAAVCAKKNPIPLSVAKRAIEDAYTLYLPGTSIAWVPPARISWDLETHPMPGGRAGRVSTGPIK